MARRNDHSREELKKMILRSALGIVGKKGFEALTARAVASDIGYAPGTIYNIFASMEDLYLSVNAHTLDKLYDALSDPACKNDTKSPLQNIKKMAELYRNFAHENRTYWVMLFTHSLPAGQKAPAWYQEKINLLFEPLEELLGPYYSTRQIKKRKMAARALWASIHGVCFLEETGKIPLINNQELATDMAQYLIENFISGITNNP